MGFFNKYPYTDFHELNLDWVLNMLKELDQEWDEFKVLNTITIAGVWDISKNYPKYAIVEDGGTGYLALKPVPAGIAINNLDYWLPVGTYSSAILDLDTRLTAAEGKITTLQGTVAGHTTQITNLSNKLDVNNILKGQIVYIGDSYLEGFTPDGPVTSWGQHLKNIMGKPNDVIIALGGTSFCNTVGGRNWVTMVDEAYNSSTVDNDKVTLVLFGGGWNEKGYSTAQITTAIQTAVTNIRSYFPNAVAMFAYMAWDRNSGNMTTYNKLYLPDRYANATKNTGISFIENIYKCLQANASYFSSDGTHPNNDGQKAIANAIYSALTGCYNGVTTESVNATGETNIFISADENIYNVLIYQPKRFAVSLTTFQCSGSNKACEIDISDKGIMPGADYYVTGISGYIEGYKNSVHCFYDVNYTVRLTAAGVLEFYPTCMNVTHDNYMDFDTVTNVYINAGNILIPKIYC